MQVGKEEIGKMKVGRYIVIDGAACRITNIQKSTPGKHGHAKYRVDAADILTDSRKNIVLSGHAKVDVPIIEKKPAQVLSVSGKTASVMDMETYETFDIEIPEEFEGKIEANTNIVYWDILGKRVIREVK